MMYNMPMPGNEHLPSAAREPIQREIISLENGPVDLFLNEHKLQIVSEPPVIEGDSRQAYLNPDIGCFVIDPDTYDVAKGIGFKALRDGESTILGRSRSHNYGRFNFKGTTSRAHVKLSRVGDEVEIIDLRSMNGTYLDRSPSELKTVRNVGAVTIKRSRETEAKREAITIAGSSVASERHPERNEDAYFVNQEAAALGVFDGVGGAPGSEEASATAAKIVDEFLSDVPTTVAPALSTLAIREALQTAHETIVSQPGGQHIATTATIAKIFENESGSQYAVVGSVGDSRAYLFRQGHIEHITLDQAYVGGINTDEAKVLQQTLSNATSLSNLSPTEQQAFFRRNIITSHLGGGKNPTITVSTFEVQAGDRILITSDGVHDNLTNQEVEQALQGHPETEVAVQSLVEAARERSNDLDHMRAKQDDITAVIMDIAAATS